MREARTLTLQAFGDQMAFRQGVGGTWQCHLGEGDDQAEQGRFPTKATLQANLELLPSLVREQSAEVHSLVREQSAEMHSLEVDTETCVPVVQTTTLEQARRSGAQRSSYYSGATGFVFSDFCDDSVDIDWLLADVEMVQELLPMLLEEEVRE